MKQSIALSYNTTALGTDQITVTGLKLGQTCFYKVATVCGAPAFKPNDTSKVEIAYVEFTNANAVFAADVAKPLSA